MTQMVQERVIEGRRVATIRGRVPMSMIGKEMEGGFGEIARAAGSAGVELDGMPFAVYYDVNADEVDVELGFPVTGDVDVGRVHTAMAEGGHVASILHVGPYEEVGPAYDTLTRWIAEHGHQVAGPPREIYLNDPTTGEEPQTEIQMPFI